MRYLRAFVLLFALCTTSLAAEYRGDCTIAFHGDSTLHAFHGTAKCRPFTASEKDGTLQIPKVTVAVADMDTDNAKRDKKLREMFEEPSYPMITGSAGPLALNDIRAAARKGSEGAKVPFQLKIRDIVKTVQGTVSNVVQSDSGMSADLSFTLSLAEYQLKPPSVIGLIRVDDQVDVKATILLHAK